MPKRIPWRVSFAGSSDKIRSVVVGQPAKGYPRHKIKEKKILGIIFLRWVVSFAEEREAAFFRSLKNDF